MNAWGCYRVERLIGRGRHSSVFLAHDQRSGRRVAMKIGRRAGGGFAREFEAGKAAAGAGLIQLYEHGDAGREAFLAMEYAPGGHAAQLARPLAASQAYAMARQAAQALARMHEAGWVHRDVKPHNLLLRADGSLALADLGSACRRGEGAQDRYVTWTGTPRYAAPEQTRGAAADPAADVYSLGIVIHEWLTGEPPFAGVTLAEVLAQHLFAPVPALPRERADWQPLLQALLAKDPRQRVADGRALVDLLTHLRPLLGGSERLP